MDPVDGGNANSYVYPGDPVNENDLSGAFPWRGLGQIGIYATAAIATTAFCAATAGVGCIMAGAAIGAGAGASANLTGQLGTGKKFSWGSFAVETGLGGALGAADGALTIKSGVRLAIERHAAHHYWVEGGQKVWRSHIEIRAWRSGVKGSVWKKAIPYGTRYLRKFGR